MSHIDEQIPHLARLLCDSVDELLEASDVVSGRHVICMDLSGGPCLLTERPRDG